MDENQEAARVVARYGKLLAVVVRSALGGRGTAEDVDECVQDVFAAYLRAPHKLDESRGGEKTYLCVLARSRARNLGKRLSAHPTVSLDEKLTLTAPDELERAQVREALLQALGNLTGEERQLFTLRFVYGWNITETARELGLSPTNVTTRTARLRKKLQRLLALQGLAVEKEDGYAVQIE